MQNPLHWVGIANFFLQLSTQTKLIKLTIAHCCYQTVILSDPSRPNPDFISAATIDPACYDIYKMGFKDGRKEGLRAGAKISRQPVVYPGCGITYSLGWDDGFDAGFAEATA